MSKANKTCLHHCAASVHGASPKMFLAAAPSHPKLRVGTELCAGPLRRLVASGGLQSKFQPAFEAFRFVVQRH